MNKLIIYGDSISSGTHGEGAYLNYIKEKLSCEILENNSIGSSGLSEVTPNNMLSVLEKQKNGEEGRGADMIFIWHGSNDWYWGTPIGEAEDEGGNTFYGAIRKAVTTLRRRNPEAYIVWGLPIFRLEKPDGMEETGNAFYLKNKAGNTMKDYAEALRDMGERCGFPVVEFHAGVNINEENEKCFLEDHVHPNALGYRMIERVLETELKKYWYFKSGEKL